LARSLFQLRLLRKLLAGLLLHQLLVFDDDLFQRLGAQLVVELEALALLDAVENLGKFGLVNIQNDVAEHLDKAAVGVIGKAGIVAEFGQSLDRMVVEAQVQDGIHHAGHGELCARAHRNQQRIIARAEFLPLQRLKPLQGSVHFGIDLGIDGTAHILAASLGLNGKARRNRQAGIGHLRQSGAFASQRVLHDAIAVSFSAAKKINVLHLACCSSRRLLRDTLSHDL